MSLTATVQDIENFRQRLSSQYGANVSLPTPYRYLNGNPVCPVPPSCVAQGCVFIVGAYPSAVFATVGSQRDVPVADISEPFSLEAKSGCELDSRYLGPLGLQRRDCWITNLVKVFLFKPGHVRKYRLLKCQHCPQETHGRFEEFAEKGFPWLREELALASPKVVITLGADVAGILRRRKGREERKKLLGGQLQESEIDSDTYPVIHLAHPGIVMRKATKKNLWPEWHEVHIAEAKSFLQRIL